MNCLNRLGPHSLPRREAPVEVAALAYASAKSGDWNVEVGGDRLELDAEMFNGCLHGTTGSVTHHTLQGDASRKHVGTDHATRWLVEIDETFRQNLRARREALGLNADQLSKLAGINRRGVRDIEEGRSQSPKLSTIASIARALDVELGELLGLGPRQKLNAELVAFLAQYDEEQQARLLAALAVLPVLRAG